MHDSTLCNAAVGQNGAGCQWLVRFAETVQVVSRLFKLSVKASGTGAYLMRTQAVQHWLHEILW